MGVIGRKINLNEEAVECLLDGPERFNQMEPEVTPLFPRCQVPIPEIHLFFCPGQLGSCNACGGPLGFAWIGLECLEKTEGNFPERSFLGLYHHVCSEIAASEIEYGGDEAIRWSREQIGNLIAWPEGVGRPNNIREVMADSRGERLCLMRDAGLLTTSTA